MSDPSGPDYIDIEPPTQLMLESMTLLELRMCVEACLEHLPTDWRGALAYSTEIDRRGFRIFPETQAEGPGPG